MDKCIALCQALAQSGHKFTLNISLGKDKLFFCTKELTSSWQMKKKSKSPSQLRREERRRVERQNKVAEEVTEDNNAVAEKERNTGKVTEKGACDQCDFKTTTEKGLKQHKTKKHEKQQQQNPSISLATPEKPRNNSQVERALITSPLPMSTREENRNNCGCPFSPSHQCEDADQGVEDADQGVEDAEPDQDDEDCEVDEVIKSPIICSCGCGAPERCPRHFEVMESRKQMLNLILEQRKKFNFK